ncbi:MAG: hypothetical protein EOP06_12980 [Proteobacteria bacterium]|nr:MAG: hypothetical protein EOP06_12980 [Pseudomonadota bacterium]
MTKMIRGLSLLGLSALTLTALSGCETGEDRSLASAQSCLDGARNASDANRCIEMVQGLTTPDSYLIRCSANFVAQGFSGQKIADVLQSLSNNSSSTADPMVTLMAYIKFDDTVGPLHTAAATEKNCELSGVRSMLRLAAAANLATTVQNIVNDLVANSGVVLTGQLTGDPVADMQVIVDTLSGQTGMSGNLSEEQAESIGAIAITANGAFCNAGSAYSTEEICKNLGNAITAPPATAESIGKNLLGLINQPNN